MQLPPNNRVSKYIQRKDRTGKKSAIIIWDFNTLLSLIDRKGIEKTIKHNRRLEQLHQPIDLTFTECCIPKETEYILFSNAHKTFTKICHILDHKTYLKFKRKKRTQFFHSWYLNFIGNSKRNIPEKYLDSCRLERHMDQSESPSEIKIKKICINWINMKVQGIKHFGLQLK